MRWLDKDDKTKKMCFVSGLQKWYAVVELGFVTTGTAWIIFKRCLGVTFFRSSMHVLNHFDSLCPHYVPVEFRCRLDIQDSDSLSRNIWNVLLMKDQMMLKLPKKMPEYKIRILWIRIRNSFNTTEILPILVWLCANN